MRSMIHGAVDDFVGRVEKPLLGRVLPVRRSLRLPDFLGIGAQKAGTTWLYANLSKYPDVFLPRAKELHYFDHQFTRPLATYARCFADAGDRCAGEVTPAYAILPPERIAFIRRIMPKVRAIMLLRDPVERAWSHASMMLSTYHGPDLDAIPIETQREVARLHAIVRRSRYDECIANWLKAVGEERLHVDYYDDVREDPDALLARVHAFLGVRPMPGGATARRVVHGGTGAPMPEWFGAMAAPLLAKDLARLAERLGGRAARWAERWGA